VDEAAFNPVPDTGNTWALRRETPVFLHAWRPFGRVSAISGLTTSKRLFFQLHRNKTIKGPDVARFLRLLLRHIEGDIIVVWDGAAQHRSKAVRATLAENPRLETVRIPAYCPELNPDEKVWNHAKNVDLKGRTARDVEELVLNVRHAFASMRRRHGLLRGLLYASELPWTPAVPQ